MAARQEDLQLMSPGHGQVGIATELHPQQEGVFIGEEVRDISVRETQLYHRVLQIAGATVKYSRETPHPDDIEDPVPLIIAKGFCGVKGAYHNLGHAMASQGKPAITIGESRFQNLSPTEQAYHLLHPELLPAMALHAVIKATKQQLDIEHCDVGGHSMGGCTAADETIHNPEDVRSLLLIATAGMDGHTLKSLTKRAPLIALDLLTGVRHMPKEMQKDISVKEILHVVLNPLRTSGEGIVVANRDIRHRVARIRANGTKVGQLSFMRDGFFSVEAARANAHLVDEFRIHPDQTLGHLGPQIDPTGTSKILLEMLDDMHSSL